MMAQLLLRYSKSRSLDELISSIRKGGHVNKLQAEIHYLDWDEIENRGRRSAPGR